MSLNCFCEMAWPSQRIYVGWSVGDMGGSSGLFLGEASIMPSVAKWARKVKNSQKSRAAFERTLVRWCCGSASASPESCRASKRN